MTDEEFAAKAARYRRRWLLVSLGYLLVSGLQLGNFFFRDSTGFGLAAGVGFAIAAAMGAISWHRGMPDTRPAPPRPPRPHC